MKKEENIELLTNDLYKEISQNQNEEIIKTREEKISVLEALKDELIVLKGLNEDRKYIEKLIKESKINIFKIKIHKFKLSVELFKQRRLANSLNKLFTKKEKPYIDSAVFTKEENQAKKR